MNNSYDLFLFAGEPSGDLHGEALLKSLYTMNRSIKVFGVGGPKMRAMGMDCIMPMEKFQVMGFIDVFLALPRLIKQFYCILHTILSKNPKVAVFIDYPGFNLRIEKHLKKKGFPGKIVHYICPSVWAWGKKRIPDMEKTLDLLLTIFPFEKRYFSSSLSVQYVGNPLVSRIKAHSYKPLNLQDDSLILALFPGSRKKEILLNFPVYLKVLKKIKKELPSIQCAISVSQEAFLPLLHSCLQAESLELSKDLYFVPQEDSYELMRKCFIAIAKSGTVTLELALHHVPTIVTYGIAPLDFFIAHNILRIYLPFYCIANIIAGKQVFCELIGPALTEDNLYTELKKLFLDASYRRACQDGCKNIETLLGNVEASEKAAESLCNLLKA